MKYDLSENTSNETKERCAKNISLDDQNGKNTHHIYSKGATAGGTPESRETHIQEKLFNSEVSVNAKNSKR